MKKCGFAAFAWVLGLAAMVVSAQAQFAGATNHGLIAVARIPADTLDAGATNRDTYGGLFSGLAFDPVSWSRSGTGSNAVFRGSVWGTAGRGFPEGTNDYAPRLQSLDFTLRLRPSGPTTPALALSPRSTVYLRYEGTNFTGAQPTDEPGGSLPVSALDGPGQGRRSLDPEGLARALDGSSYVADEFAPVVYRFNHTGELQETFRAPEAFFPKRGAYPGTNDFGPALAPASGRKYDRGFEAVCLSPDERRLFALMQSPLIQDGGITNSSRYARLLVFDLDHASSTYGRPIGEFAYPLTLNGNPSRNAQTLIGDMVALNRESLLVLERDEAGLGANNTMPLYKRVVLASIRGARNLINTGYDYEAGAPGALALPPSLTPSAPTPMSRTDLVDLLDATSLARFGLSADPASTNAVPEKWEGLTLVPMADEVATNDYLLFVGNDNEFRAPVTLQGGVEVATNQVVVDNWLWVYRLSLPGVGAAAPANVRPSLTLTGTTNALLSYPARVLLQTSAYDSDGLVTKVEFLDGTNQLTVLTNYPFDLLLTNLAPKTYQFKAIATDNQGASTASSTKTIILTATNQLPRVQLTGPTNITLSAPANFTLSATATDVDGGVQSVVFYDQTNVVAADFTAPFSLTLTNAPSAIYNYAVVATDNQGASSTSAVVRVIVTDTNLAPDVELTQPLGPTNVFTPASLTLAANANDPDGRVVRVEFYRDSLRLGQDTSAPFTLLVADQPLGVHAYQAAAIDNQNRTNWSAPVQVTITPPTTASLTVQLLHAGDFEAGRAALTDAPRFSSVLNALQAAYPSNTLIVSCGDNYRPGPFFDASGATSTGYGGVRGRADVVLLNAFGVQASAMGPHEFDPGVSGLKSLLVADPSIGYPGTAFPYLAANAVFSTETQLRGLVGTDAQDYRRVTNRLARSTVISLGTERIGVIGVTLPRLREWAYSGLITISSNVVDDAQRAANALGEQGINKIVLLSHLQDWTQEVELAKRLRGVDIVVASDSRHLLANSSDRLQPGDRRADDYPVRLTSESGEPVCLVNVRGEFAYLGRLVIDFDAQGRVQQVAPASGVYAIDEQAVKDTGNVAASPAVLTNVTAFANLIEPRDGDLLAFGKVHLNGRSESLRSEETNLGDLVADANLAHARHRDATVAVSLVHAGSIQNSIGSVTWNADEPIYGLTPPNPSVGKREGMISRLDVESALGLNYGLNLTSLRPDQLRDVLEWSVADLGNTDQFLQVSGLSFSFDPSRPAMTYNRATNGTITSIATTGQRVRSVVVTNANGTLDVLVEDGNLVGNTNRLLRVVASEYLVAGLGGYLPLTQGRSKVSLTTNAPVRYYETEGTECRALAELLDTTGLVVQPDQPAALDERIQNLSLRSDTVIQPLALRIAPSANRVFLSFQSYPGKTYTMEATPDLAQNWLATTNAPAVGDGGTKTLQLPLPAGGVQFYRLRVTP